MNSLGGIAMERGDLAAAVAWFSKALAAKPDFANAHYGWALALSTQGRDEEEAAVVLGARGWQTLWYVTLPNVKWGLLYGVILCNARAMGEFGAVSVVSGHIRGLTNTMPLHVEILYNEYQFAAAFAVASVLALLALVTLVIKAWVERQVGKTGAEA